MAAINSTYWTNYFSAWYWPPLYWPIYVFYDDGCPPAYFINGILLGVVASGLLLGAVVTADWYKLDVSDLNLGVTASAYGDIEVELTICH